MSAGRRHPLGGARSATRPRCAETRNRGAVTRTGRPPLGARTARARRRGPGPPVRRSAAAARPAGCEDVAAQRGVASRAGLRAAGPRARAATTALRRQQPSTTNADRPREAPPSRWPGNAGPGEEPPTGEEPLCGSRPQAGPPATGAPPTSTGLRRRQEAPSGQGPQALPPETGAPPPVLRRRAPALSNPAPSRRHKDRPLRAPAANAGPGTGTAEGEYGGGRGRSRDRNRPSGTAAPATSTAEDAYAPGPQGGEPRPDWPPPPPDPSREVREVREVRQVREIPEGRQGREAGSGIPGQGSAAPAGREPGRGRRAGAGGVSRGSWPSPAGPPSRPAPRASP